MWTVGVIVFILLGGYYPFRGKTDAEILKNVRYGNFEFREKLWKGISDDAKALLRSMMTVNPDERVSAEAALCHPWIKSDNSVLSADLIENVAEIRKEVAQKFKAAVKTVLATQRLQRHVYY
jgi:calcium-dependent protein kinase